jgi:hypothetical protein
MRSSAELSFVHRLRLAVPLGSDQIFFVRRWEVALGVPSYTALGTVGNEEPVREAWQLVKETVASFLGDEALSRGAAIAFFALPHWRPSC